jgi:hypothetical protein
VSRVYVLLNTSMSMNPLPHTHGYLFTILHGSLSPADAGGGSGT